MRLLHRLGYTNLSMAAAMPYLRGERPGAAASGQGPICGGCRASP
jgi:hypothetical protein